MAAFYTEKENTLRYCIARSFLGFEIDFLFEVEN